MTDNETQAHTFASPLGALRWKLRTESGNMRLTSARDVRVAVAAVLDAPEWTQAAEEVNALRTQLAHWKVFAEHAEGERSRLKHNEAVMMNALYKACGDDEEMVRRTLRAEAEVALLRAALTLPENATEPMQKAMQRAVLLRKSMNEVWRAALSELGA